MKRSLLAFLAISVALTAASTALAQPTREQYIAQADPICLGSLEAQGRALRGFVSDVKHGDLKKAAGKMRRAGGEFSSGINGLAALEEPPADASLLGSWIQSLRAQVPIVNRFSQALAHRRVRQLRRSAVQLQSAAAYSHSLVKDYGFLVCGSF
jgi:hypothetical protein